MDKPVEPAFVVDVAGVADTGRYECDCGPQIPCWAKVPVGVPEVTKLEGAGGVSGASEVMLPDAAIPGLGDHFGQRGARSTLAVRCGLGKTH